MTEKDLIAACRQQDRKAQKLLYERFSSVMLGVCRRYVKDPKEAEDVMVEGFFKVLTKLDMYNGDGSFEGWIRRIMINESLMHLRKNNHFQYAEEINPNLDYQEESTVLDRIAAEEILALLAELPPGYRTVFNLYVVEGYKHREIADELGISVNTSKSQLILAKNRMGELVKKRLGRVGK
ncbi:MAG: sigma-70 family RNA polymerase sigma factor [Bacteroidetes bacterium]|nr:sigma-70 family RNA polymerase sigma factor [Bacteroidota bacterium]